MLDRLEHKGFLARQRSEADRRQVQLVLTAQGQQLADRLPDIGVAAMNELAGAITEQELATLEQILKKILVAADDSITLLRVGDK
jgi:DNA-binding MarR family transcriptional regulator